MYEYLNRKTKIHEQLPAGTLEKEQSASRERRAIQEAFEPSGVSGERLETVAAKFDEALDSGLSYDTALNEAVAEAKVIGSSPSELKSYFWDSMDPNRVEGERPTRAIDRALTGLGLEDERYEESKMKFSSALLQKERYVQDWDNAAPTREYLDHLASLDYPIDMALLHATNQFKESPANIAARERFYGGIDPNRGRDDQPESHTRELQLGEFAAGHAE